MRCNKARQEIIWERHHGAGSVVPFSLQAGNDIFFRFYLTKAEGNAFTYGDFFYYLFLIYYRIKHLLHVCFHSSLKSFRPFQTDFSAGF